MHWPFAFFLKQREKREKEKKCICKTIARLYKEDELISHQNVKVLWMNVWLEVCNVAKSSSNWVQIAVYEDKHFSFISLNLLHLQICQSVYRFNFRCLSVLCTNVHNQSIYEHRVIAAHWTSVQSDFNAFKQALF